MAVAAGPDAEGGAGDVPAGAQAARQREPQLHQVVRVEPHRPPGSLVDGPVGLAAHEPDLPGHLALRQRAAPRMRQLFIAAAPIIRSNLLSARMHGGLRTKSSPLLFVLLRTRSWIAKLSITW